YVIICSVGIALALLGIIFLHLSSMDLVKDTNFELSWTYLVGHAGELQKSTLRLSFIFILIGFGTKSGLAPMHTWLPDAHSQAPSPISALLSGVLLNSAMYGIMRELAIVNRSIGTEFASRLLLGIGILSILTAALFIITQKDYKRLLAYSSIEHMGIIAWGLGLFTPVSVLASLMHMLNHSFTKSMLFLSSGNVFLKFKTKEIKKVTGLLKVMPVTGTIFLLGIFAITGMPPFSIFTSEFGILIATFKTLPVWISVIFVLLIASVFVGFAVALLKMFYGEPEEFDSCKTSKISTAVLVALFVIILVTGLFIPRQVMDTFIRAQKIVTGG
ncbi:MAG TPA: proton-conducting transporter membrane subunit, partial [Clostridia bacterium]